MPETRKTSAERELYLFLHEAEPRWITMNHHYRDSLNVLLMTALSSPDQWEADEREQRARAVQQLAAAYHLRRGGKGHWAGGLHVLGGHLAAVWLAAHLDRVLPRAAAVADVHQAVADLLTAQWGSPQPPPLPNPDEPPDIKGRVHASMRLHRAMTVRADELHELRLDRPVHTLTAYGRHEIVVAHGRLAHEVLPLALEHQRDIRLGHAPEGEMATLADTLTRFLPHAAQHTTPHPG